MTFEKKYISLEYLIKYVILILGLFMTYKFLPLEQKVYEVELKSIENHGEIQQIKGGYGHIEKDVEDLASDVDEFRQEVREDLQVIQQDIKELIKE